ncbi:hypothetical protein BS47DRAFT_1370657 [Hydnum rufescens UP504]|uniref:Uncharacterized protein n=1 Tax=Hydnum rufescens UP504 TaxID=1448309 RepID=A0A9P6B8N9_9AGAM|nr:hypothetical protein BS47DRAFT_1370657 [Hydnum rufescens UP504]
MPILRGQLHSKPSNGHIAFIPQIRKLVFESCETWPTSAPLREVLGLHAETPARENPHKRMYREPIVRGFYLNGRTKVIGLGKLTKGEVMDKIQLLLDSLGAKIKSLKSQPVQSTTPSTRGIWSGMHVEEPFNI